MSDYVPTDWVDDVTPVDAARMDKIEAGIDTNRDLVIDHETRLDAAEAALPGKEDKSAKGAANGYAPLGADTKVPALYLPAGGSGAVDYENAWAAGTAYTPGDVVIHNGIEYLAVNPSTGQTPPPSPAVAGATVIPLVTTLPASPFDGQEVDLTDSLLTPSWVWRFRYVAAAPTNKWKFVGGPPVFSSIETIEAVSTTGAWADTPTVGPTITLALAGDYYLEWDVAVSSATTNILVYCGPAVGAGTPLSAAVQMIHTVGGLGWNHTFGSHWRANSLAAGTVLRMRYQNPNESHWLNRRLSVLPVAVT
jgi:hypothetical protein